MMKTIARKAAFPVCWALALMLMLCLAAAPALAKTKEQAPRLVDNAHLLSTDEQEQLRAHLDEISERQQLDVVVVTTNSLKGKTPEAYADDYYDNHGYGFGKSHDGILLLVSMEDRDWHITTTGFAITAFTDDGLEYISDKFLSDLGDGEYAAAFTTFADQCDAFITQARTGEPYDGSNMPKEEFDPVVALIVALFIGFIVASIITGRWKKQLETVNAQTHANQYVKPGSLHITDRSDRLVDTKVVSTVRVSDDHDGGGGSSTHFSSSGVEHGGAGGKF